MKQYTLSLLLALDVACSADADEGNDVWFKLGGAARFNYAVRDYGPSGKWG